MDRARTNDFPSLRSIYLDNAQNINRTRNGDDSHPVLRPVLMRSHSVRGNNPDFFYLGYL